MVLWSADGAGHSAAGPSPTALERLRQEGLSSPGACKVSLGNAARTSSKNKNRKERRRGETTPLASVWVSSALGLTSGKLERGEENGGGGDGR